MFAPLSFGETKNLPVYVLGSRSLPHQGKAKYVSGFARCCQISVCTGGCGVFIDHNKNKCQVKEGDAFYFREGVAVEYFPVTTRWESKYILLGGTSLNSLMDYLGYAPSGVIHLKRHCVFEQVNQMAENIVEINKINTQLSHGELSYMAYELLLSASSSLGGISGSDSAKSKLEPIVKLIGERYTEDLSLELLSKTAGYNPTYTEKLFRLVYHTTPINYLIQVRIANAKRLLSSDLSLTVKQVGEKCGFNDNSYFGKVFKKFTGVTPREYRAANTYIEK